MYVGIGTIQQIFFMRFMTLQRERNCLKELKQFQRSRSDPPPQPSPTRGEGVFAKQQLNLFPLPLWEGVRGRGVNVYVPVDHLA